MILYTFTTIFITITYLLIIISFSAGWQKIKYFRKGLSDPFSVRLSLVIAVRNEEYNIPTLLTSLINQSLPQNNYEIILVDDHSTDNTLGIINNLKPKLPNLHVLKLRQFCGKKNALQLGIKNATGKLIVTTDADCTHHKNWLKTIASFYLEKQAKLIIGPVIMNGMSCFQKMQALDFYSLTASGAGAAGIGKPIMCSGANLAFEKDIYDEIVNPYNLNQVSGDDVFLLLKIKKQMKNKIFFLKSNDAMVFTTAESSFVKFIRQRTRWASKSTDYKDFDIILTAFTVLGINLLLLINFTMSFFSQPFLKLFFVQLVLKSFFDFILLYISSTTFKQKKLLKYFLPAQLFNILMIPYLAISGISKSVKWKDRTL